MTRKEIEERLIQQVKMFRHLGYTFKSLVDYTLMEARYTSELEQRLRLIDKSDGKVCLCSVMVNDQEKEGNTVPLLYCVIKEGKDRLKDGVACAYFTPSSNELVKALELHEELKKEK